MSLLTGDLDCDCELLLMEIKKMKLHTATNRKTLNPTGKAPISDVYGLTKWKNYSNKTSRIESDRFPGYYNTKLKTNYPVFQEFLDEFSYFYLPESFKWSSVTINKNFKCKPHKDGSNIGLSYIVGLGDYKGGNVIVEQEDGSVKFLDIRHKPCGFNGSELTHYTSDFRGDRYSVVFYNNLN